MMLWANTANLPNLSLPLVEIIASRSTQYDMGFNCHSPLHPVLTTIKTQQSHQQIWFYDFLIHPKGVEMRGSCWCMFVNRTRQAMCFEIESAVIMDNVKWWLFGVFANIRISVNKMYLPFVSSFGVSETWQIIPIFLMTIWIKWQKNVDRKLNPVLNAGFVS